MRLNQKIRYGLECLFELASNPTEFIDAEKIAVARNIPRAYAQKILHALTQSGLVLSQKGAGFRLSRPLIDITALEVVQALEMEDRRVLAEAHPLERRILAALAGVSLETLSSQTSAQ